LTAHWSESAGSPRKLLGKNCIMSDNVDYAHSSNYVEEGNCSSWHTHNCLFPQSVVRVYVTVGLPNRWYWALFNFACFDEVVIRLKCWNFAKMFSTGRTRVMALPYAEESMTIC